MTFDILLRLSVVEAEEMVRMSRDATWLEGLKAEASEAPESVLLAADQNVAKQLSKFAVRGTASSRLNDPYREILPIGVLTMKTLISRFGWTSAGRLMEMTIIERTAWIAGMSQKAKTAVLEEVNKLGETGTLQMEDLDSQILAKSWLVKGYRELAALLQGE